MLEEEKQISHISEGIALPVHKDPRRTNIEETEIIKTEKSSA